MPDTQLQMGLQTIVRNTRRMQRCNGWVAPPLQSLAQWLGLNSAPPTAVSQSVKPRSSVYVRGSLFCSRVADANPYQVCSIDCFFSRAADADRRQEPIVGLDALHLPFRPQDFVVKHQAFISPGARVPEKLRQRFFLGEEEALTLRQVNAPLHKLRHIELTPRGLFLGTNASASFLLRIFPLRKRKTTRNHSVRKRNDHWKIMVWATC